jgi:hypothetical protein
MKKVTLILAAFVALAACSGPAENAADTNTEAHDHSGHDHGSMEMDDLVPAEERLYVPEGAYVFFQNLKDGAKVKSPIAIEFGIEGMEVVPAGPITKGTGHHHLIINSGFTAPGTVIPADENNIHFGQGQTNTTLELQPGTYLLTMQFANGIHESYGEQMSSTIKITVE